jgi:glutaredoxin
MHKYFIISREGCPFCDKALELLHEKEIPYRDVIFDSKTNDILEQFKYIFGWTTVPMIFEVLEDESFKLIGGFSDLKELLDDSGK